MKLVLSTILILSSLCSIRAERRCVGGGGDGGIPLEFVPPGVASNSNWVKLHDLFTDFILWEKTNRVLYINRLNGFTIFNLATQNAKSLFLDGAHGSISRVKDPENRFFTDSRGEVVFDSLSGEYRALPYSMSNSKELFWHNSVLYSWAGNYRNVTRIFAYNAKTEKVSSCLVNTFSPDVHFTASAMNAYPYVYGYDQSPTSNGEFQVRKVRIDVREMIGSDSVCMVFLEPYYNEPFPGQVLEMYRYPHLQANIYVVEHPTKQLLWDLGDKECTFYNLEGKNYSVLNSDVPVVALWEDGQNPNLLYPRRMQRRSLPGVGQFGLTSEDFALSQDGRAIFVSQKAESNNNEKVLFKYDLEVIP